MYALYFYSASVINFSKNIKLEQNFYAGREKTYLAMEITLSFYLKSNIKLIRKSFWRSLESMHYSIVDVLIKYFKNCFP